MKKCPHHKICRNGGDGCTYISKNPNECIRYLPLNNTNIFNFNGAIEVRNEIDIKTFSQEVDNFIQSKGWSATISIWPYEEEK